MARKHGLLGNVELLGLNAFGGEISPLWGTLIGGGVAKGTSLVLAHQSPALAANREQWGFLAGLGAAGIMFAMPSTKRAAFGAVVGAVLGSGLSWLEKMMWPVQVAAATLPAAAAASGTAGARIHTLNGLGIRQALALNGGLGLRRQPNGTHLNGLGITTIADQPQSVGTIPGVAGPAFAGTRMGGGSPVQLLGGPSTRSNQISLMGGPQVHGLSAAYGATLLGGR
jgi:hypothetical protein